MTLMIVVETVAAAGKAKTWLGKAERTKQPGPRGEGASGPRPSPLLLTFVAFHQTMRDRATRLQTLYADGCVGMACGLEKDCETT